MIENGGVKMNSEKINDIFTEVSIVDGMILQVGKRKMLKLKL
jgi:tyrosyl-tRNA synthetase